MIAINLPGQSCPPPGVVPVSRGLNSVTLRADTAAGPFWQLRYAATQNGLSAAPLLQAGARSFLLSGLPAETAYFYQVRDSCNGTFGNWSSPRIFRTACLVAAPWQEDFNNGRFQVAQGQGQPGSLDSCWFTRDNYGLQWFTGPPQNTFGKLPTPIAGSGKYLTTYNYRNYYPYDSSSVTRVQTPYVVLDSLSRPRLRFFSHIISPNVAYLQVEAIDKSQQAYPIFNLRQAQQITGNSPWSEHRVSLSAFAQDTIALRFSAKIADAENKFIAIDEISIENRPACPRPDSLRYLFTGHNKALLTWKGFNASQWEVAYSDSLNNPALAPGVLVSGQPSLQLNNLAPQTSYKVWVRTRCGSQDSSGWWGPLAFTTRCAPLKAPWQEDFEAPQFIAKPYNEQIPQCWQRDTITSRWRPTNGNMTSVYTGPFKDHTKGPSAQFIQSRRAITRALTVMRKETQLRLPLIDLDTLSRPQISFWYHANSPVLRSFDLVARKTNGTSRTLWTLQHRAPNSSFAPWLRGHVRLDSFAGDTLSLSFYARGVPGFNQPQISLDDITIGNAPPCMPPQQLKLLGITDSSASLNWQGGNGPFTLSYGPFGFDPATAPQLTVSAPPYQLTGLKANAAYEVRVRSQCAGGVSSEWSAPIRFQTQCGITHTPYLNTFETRDWDGQGSGGFNPITSAVIGNCWSGPNYPGTYVWGGQTDNNARFFTTIRNHTPGGNIFLLTYQVPPYGFFDTIATVITDSIWISGLQKPQLRFFEFRPNANGRLVVEIDSGGGFHSFLNLNGASPKASQKRWNEQLHPLSAYKDDTLRLRFTGYTETAIAIDDLEIREKPLCGRPLIPEVIQRETRALTLRWDTGAPGVRTWELRYRQKGLKGPYRTATVHKNPFRLAGLKPATHYEFQVRTLCDTNLTSAYSTWVSARTNCGVTPAPFYESFNGSLWKENNYSNYPPSRIDSCWQSMPNKPLRVRSSGTGNSGPATGVGQGGKFLSSSNGDSSLITSPAIYLPGSLDQPYASYAYHLYGSQIEQLRVFLKVNQGPFTLVDSFVAPTQYGSYDPWKYDTIPLHTYMRDTVQIRFLITTTTYGNRGAIDEFRVDGSPAPCAAPDSLLVSPLNYTTAQVQWQGTNAANRTLLYFPLSQDDTAATVIHNPSSPDTLRGLQPGTTYRLILQDSCANGSLSPPLDTNFTTPLCPLVNAAFSDSSRYLGTHFQPRELDPADSLIWHFGNGDTSRAFQPFAQFDSAGTYTITLYAYNKCGNGDTNQISLTLCDTLKPDFTYVTIGDSIVFNAASSQNAAGYRWDFGNGQTGQADYAIVEYDTTAQLVFPVTLKVYNNCGDTLQITRNVGFCGEPIADWTYSTLSPTGTGLRILFDASISQNAEDFFWDFGDGATDTGTYPIHTYSTPAFSYQVTLIATNKCQQSDTMVARLQDMVSIPWHQALPAVQVYPNPVQESLQIRWRHQDLSLTRLHFYDAQGALVKTAVPRHKGRHVLEVENLSPGTYWLELVATSGQKWRMAVLIK